MNLQPEPFEGIQKKVWKMESVEKKRKKKNYLWKDEKGRGKKRKKKKTHRNNFLWANF